MKKFQLKTLIILSIVILLYGRNLRKIIILERVGTGDENYFDPKVLICEIGIKKFDRYTIAVNLTWDIKIDINFPIMVNAKLLKLDNNEYKETAFTFRKDICEYLDLTSTFVSDKSHLGFTGCPIKKGIYHMTNMSVNEINENFINLLPLWKGKIVIDLTRTDNQQLIARNAIYGHVEQI